MGTRSCTILLCTFTKTGIHFAMRLELTGRSPSHKANLHLLCSEFHVRMKRICQNCWWHRHGRTPSGGICYPRLTARCGTRTRSSCVAASGISEGLSALHSHVLDTLSEARAPSKRRLYALKWGVFVKWCGQAHIDPATCTRLF